MKQAKTIVAPQIMAGKDGMLRHEGFTMRTRGSSILPGKNGQNKKVPPQRQEVDVLKAQKKS